MSYLKRPKVKCSVTSSYSAKNVQTIQFIDLLIYKVCMVQRSEKPRGGDSCVRVVVCLQTNISFFSSRGRIYVSELIKAAFICEYYVAEQNM